MYRWQHSEGLPASCSRRAAARRVFPFSETAENQVSGKNPGFNATARNYTPGGSFGQCGGEPLECRAPRLLASHSWWCRANVLWNCLWLPTFDCAQGWGIWLVAIVRMTRLGRHRHCHLDLLARGLLCLLRLGQSPFLFLAERRGYAWP